MPAGVQARITPGLTGTADLQGQSVDVAVAQVRPVPGLGVLAGSVTRLDSQRLKVPHVGWNQLHLTKQDEQCPLLVDVAEGTNAYFTHS